MSTSNHRATPIATHDPAWGVFDPIQQTMVLTGPGNRSVAYQAAHSNGETRLIHRNAVLETYDLRDNPRIDMSLKGEIAFGLCTYGPRQSIGDSGLYVSVDGKEMAHDHNDATTMARLHWIPGLGLACEAWKDARGRSQDGIDGPIKYFLNGKELTGTFWFHLHFEGDIIVWYQGMGLHIGVDGKLLAFKYFTNMGDMERAFRPPLTRSVDDPDRPERDDVNEKWRMRVGNDLGPAFDELSSESLVWNADRSLYAYVGGIQDPTIMQEAEKLHAEMEAYEASLTAEQQAKLSQGDDDPKMLEFGERSQTLMQRERFTSTKHFVVKGTTQWPEGYLQVTTPLFVGDGSKVVVAAVDMVGPEKFGQRVVIDGVPGPMWEAVYGLEADGTHGVSYVAYDHGVFYRVTCSL